MARIARELEKKIRILKDLYSNMDMTLNTNKTKVMIIKSNNIFITSSTRTIALRKRINGGCKSYYGLEKIWKQMGLWV